MCFQLTDNNKQPKCVSPSPCYTAICNSKLGTCDLSAIDPPPFPSCACNKTGPEPCQPIPCYNVSYNPNSSSCCSYTFACDDNNPCTVDTCGTDGQCVNQLKSCDDGNLCTADSCDTKTGGCINLPSTTVCNDNSECTKDICSDVGQNCSNVYIPCVSDNMCLTPICLPVSGCVMTNTSCDDFNPCTIDSCDPFVGCKHEYKVCTMLDIDYDITGRCGLTSCNESNGNCTFRDVGCGTNDNVALIAGITTGVIVGIIVAIVICGLVTGGTVTAYHKLGEDCASPAINSNPLYKSNQNGGDNPLFKQP